MIVSEFIDWLKTQDQGATVQVLVRDNGGNPHSSCADYQTRWEDFEAKTHADYPVVQERINPVAAGIIPRTLFLGLEE